MTSQLGHPAAWRKAHRRRLALVGLGPVEMLLVLVLDVVGVRDLDRRAAEAIAAGSPAIRAEISARAAHVLGQDRAEWWIQARTIGPSRAADYVFVKGDMDPG